MPSHMDYPQTPNCCVRKMISSTHTMGAIKPMLTLKQEKENTIYGNDAILLAITTDFSMQMIAACVSEFNDGITVRVSQSML